MATSGGLDRLDTADRIQLGGFVLICTIVLLTVFVGVEAVITGVSGFSERVPIYVLMMALTFFGAIIAFEAELDGGPASLFWACGAAIGTFGLIVLAGEGTAFLIRNLTGLVLIEIAFYVLGAVLAGSAVGYWAVQHWETLSATGPGL